MTKNIFKTQIKLHIHVTHTFRRFIMTFNTCLMNKNLKLNNKSFNSIINAKLEIELRNSRRKKIETLPYEFEEKRA